jgi:circadian clock protein KaiC
MRKKIQLIPSGISFVDEAWGGLYNCGTYLLVGPHKSGRTLLGLQFTQEAINQQNVCIYFTNMRPKDLMIHAASINFDLQHHMDQNRVILIRINAPKEKDVEEDPDKYLSVYLQEIIAIVEQYQPGKIVFDELTPFVNFNDVNKLEEVYLQTCEVIENLGVTSLFILSEPVSPQSRDIVDLLQKNSTGLIQLKKKENSEGLFYGGSLIITPNIGHTEGQFKIDYSIQPKKGVVSEFISSTQPSDKLKPQKKKKETHYKALSEIETHGENFPVINFYNEKEFRLLLNNQLAYFKSTGQVFTLCSIFLDDIAGEKGLLTLNQLKNAVRLSIDKKDKITVVDNRIIVLVVDEDQKVVNSLLARIKSNLPVENSEQLIKIIQHISVYTLQVDENMDSADDLLKKILSDRVNDKTV